MERLLEELDGKVIAACRAGTPDGANALYDGADYLHDVNSTASVISRQ